MIALIALIALGVIAVFVLLFIFLPVVAWIILGLIALLIILILVVPIGADVGYVGGEFTLAARVDRFALQLLPKNHSDPNKPPTEPKEKKPKKEKEKKEKPAKEKKPRKLPEFSAEEIFELIKKVLHGLGKFGKLTVHRFMLHYVAAGEDPYKTAMTYNYVNAALSSLAPVAAQKFKVKGDVDVWTDIDFTEEKMKLDAEVSVTIRLAQVFHMAFAVAFGALGILIKNKIRLARENRQNRKNPPADNDEVINIENSTKENIQAEERNDSNG